MIDNKQRQQSSLILFSFIFIDYTFLMDRLDGSLRIRDVLVLVVRTIDFILQTRHI